MSFSHPNQAMTTYTRTVPGRPIPSKRVLSLELYYSEVEVSLHFEITIQKEKCSTYERKALSVNNIKGQLLTKY